MLVGLAHLLIRYCGTADTAQRKRAPTTMPTPLFLRASGKILNPVMRRAAIGVDLDAAAAKEFALELCEVVG